MSNSSPTATERPLASSQASTWPTDSWTVSRSVCTAISGSNGSSYGSETPVKFLISPASALAYRPLTSRSAQVDPVAGLAVGGDRGHHHGHAVLGQLAGHVADPGDVGVAVLAAEPEALAEVGADLVPVEHLDTVPAFGQARRDRVGDGGLPGAGQAGEPEDEAVVDVHAGGVSWGRDGTIGTAARGQLACSR